MSIIASLVKARLAAMLLRRPQLAAAAAVLWLARRAYRARRARRRAG